MRRIRRILAHGSIRKFLSAYLPRIGLGELKEFKCKNFDLGDYEVITQKGTYHLCFWEDVGSAKEFSLWLNEDANYLEVITFSILGFWKFKIQPDHMTIDRIFKREVINLQNGTAKLYMLGEKSDSVKFNHIEFKEPFLESDFLDIRNVLKETQEIKYLFR